MRSPVITGQLVIVPKRFVKAHHLQGEIFIEKFRIANDSKATWELKKQTFEPTCACTDISVEPKILLPGTAGTISVSVNTNGVRGLRRINVTTLWQQESRPNIQLRKELSVQLNVESLFGIYPGSINLGRISWESLKAGVSFDVKRGDSVLAWNGIIADSVVFGVDVVKQDADLFRVHATPIVTDPSYGYFSAAIDVAAQYDGKSLGPTYQVPINAWIDPGVGVTPATIFSNTLSVDEVAGGMISLKSEGVDFRVISVTVPEPEFLKFEPVVKDGKTTELRYKMTGIKQGQHSGIATVTMRLGAETRKFSLPYIVFVKGGAQ